MNILRTLPKHAASDSRENTGRPPLPDASSDVARSEAAASGGLLYDQEVSHEMPMCEIVPESNDVVGHRLERISS